MAPPDPVSADLLLAHSAFLMALARSLVLDEQRAEDVVQQTYLAALRKPPPRHVRLRAWLGAVARNLALRSRRTEGRLKRRAEAAPPRDAPAPTDDIVARLEVQRRIAEAVGKLDEPGRSAIVYRYFDGLTPAEIAHHEGVSVRTIESRLRRARETLRTRLDAAYGGNRMTWCAILAPSLGISLEALGSSAGGAATGAATATATASTTPALTAAGTAVALTGVTLMSTKMVAAVAVICAAGAFFAGRHLAPVQPEPVLTDTTVADTPAEEAPELGTEATMRDSLRRELTAEQEKVADLTSELARLREKYEPEPAPTLKDGTELPLALDLPKKPRFVYDAVGSALDDKDWPTYGEAVTHLLPLIVSLKKALLDEAPMPENVGDIQRWNGELVNLAVSLDRTDLTGTGTNGHFTHPSVVVNLVHAALLEAQQPLSERQEEQLREIGDRYVTDEGRRAMSYGEDVLQLQKTIEETALKDRFYAEVDGMLTEAQRNVLHPKEIRGRMGVDIFSSGVIWYVVSKPVSFTTRKDLAETLLKQTVSMPGYDEQHADIYQDAAHEWANSFSDEFLAASDDPLARKSSAMNAGLIAGWATVTQAHAAAEAQLALNRRLIERLPPDAKLVPMLRDSPRVFIPLKKAAE